MSVMQGARYTQSHEYVVKAGEEVVVGITPYAAAQLGDVVFVELPAVGTRLSKGQSFGVVESVKAVSDLYAPIDGEVVAVNEAVVEEPALIGEDAQGRGWMLRVRPADWGQLEGSDLMTADQYESFSGEH
jgi:glycine cleavage system H protein